MALTHYQLIEIAESQLIEAMTKRDQMALGKLCDEAIIYTNEVGKTYRGFDTLQIRHPDVITFSEIETLERGIKLFDNVAIVNSIERRTGTYQSLAFSREYNLTRVWKFRIGWKLIATTSLMLDDSVHIPIYD